MTKSKNDIVLMISIALAPCAVGCRLGAQEEQPLPTPYYLQDDVSYSPTGPEFKLPREVADLKAPE